MWIWDGTDRREDDVEAAFADAIRRAFISGNHALTAQMKTYVAGFALALTDRTGSALVAPEPLIQGGFTPSHDERTLLCDMARTSGRDIVHICFRTVEPVTPTGLITVAWHDGEQIRLHSRTSLVWVDKDARVSLYGVEDARDMPCHFMLRAGKKMVRGEGLPTPAETREMRLAGAHVEKLIARGATDGASSERLMFFHQLPRGADGKIIRNVFSLAGMTA
jgi:hypothetical protein